MSGLKRLGTVALALFALAVTAVAPAAALEVPYLSGRVVDLADLIPPDEEARIEAALEAIETAHGSQVAVLTIPSLEGEVLEDYSLRVVETWKLGRGDVDDGALLLIARDDRKMRFEVGYGLEPTLTDARTRRILDDVLRPRFRAGDFAGGIREAVNKTADLIAGDDTLPPPSTDGNNDFAELPFVGKLGVFAFFLLIVGIFSMLALFTEGCAGWFLYFFLMPFWGTFPVAIWGLPFGAVFPVAWIVLFPILRLLIHHANPKGRLGRVRKWSKPYIASSTRSWSSGGGGFSGGGFSGGGGSFGGGGSSSSW